MPNSASVPQTRSSESAPPLPAKAASSDAGTGPASTQAIRGGTAIRFPSAMACETDSGDALAQRLDRVRFPCRLVGADAADPREAHCEAGFVPPRFVDRIEGDFEDQALVGLADRSEAIDRVGADMVIEPFQLLVGEAEIGLAHGQQLALGRPG